MEIKIEVKAKSARNRVEESADKIIVKTKEPTKNNMANNSVIKILSEYWNISETDIRIIKGQKSKNKVIEVKNENILTKKRG